MNMESHKPAKKPIRHTGWGLQIAFKLLFMAEVKYHLRPTTWRFAYVYKI